jgi:hypothetical protein
MSYVNHSKRGRDARRSVAAGGPQRKGGALQMRWGAVTSYPYKLAGTGGLMNGYEHETADPLRVANDDAGAS